jgi:hypothetical protein
MRFIFALFIAAACFGQDKQNVVQTGIVDARGANWIPPTVTYASLPASPTTGTVYIVTDTLCTGSGTGPAICRWSGSAWSALGGGGSAASPCTSGTVSYSALNVAAASREITIQTAVSGNTRWMGIVLSETTQFAGTTGLTVSMGRPGSTTHAEMTNGTAFPLMVSSGDVNYISTRPIPPQITSTYDIVLNFAVTSGNVNAATAGALTWEVCGYAAR